MSLLSWNCQGAGSTETVQYLRDLCKQFAPDFVFLMETKQKFSYMQTLQLSLGYDHLVTVEPEGLSGGLTVMWKNCYEVEVLVKNKRLIDLDVRMGSISFFISCVYGDPIREQRQRVWDQLINIGLLRNEAWVLVGDFNELMSNDEKLGGAVRNDSTFWDFRRMAVECKIKDLSFAGNSMSWAGWRDNVWVQCRLDRSFGNDNWFTLFPRCKTDYMDLWGSDHRPIKLTFAWEVEEQGRGRFYFDKRMVGKPGVEEAVRKGWSGATISDNTPLMDRIAGCRQALAKWKRQNNLNSRDKISRLRHELEQEVSKLRPRASVMRRIKTTLAQAYKDEELYWRQKSQEQWLKAGDKNTPFFQNSVKGRKIRNRVIMLKNVTGEEVFSEGAKGQIAVEYFRDLFMSSNPYDLESLFAGFTGRVTPEMNEALTSPISEEEIQRAAFSVKGSSAPGEDGLTGSFYKHFWNIVGPKVTEEIRSFFATAILPSGWNHTQLCLLPKILNPTEMKDMRPISLCSVHYKIISKILCSRLKGILPSIISDTQGAFVSGRLITDNVIIAHEMVHSLRTRDKVSDTFMAVKTDMSKAYDRVEWCFLETLMEKMNFDRVWIRWIMSCVSSVTYSVLLNGRAHGFIKPERGIRQGDPLSPFLFIMCAEALVSCLNDSEACGRLHGIKLTTPSPAVHHLLFADDSLFLCRANVEESMEIARCLKLYGDASGQLINLQKSSIIFGTKVSDNIKMEVKETLGIMKEGGDGVYLGLPECFNGSKKALLNFIRERLQGRLKGWFSKALSQGGKEILIKSVCLALPVYAMSVFKLPKELCDKLTSALIEFWWSSGNNRKKISWVAWQKLCKRKEEGGLGFHDISRFNQALLGKQAWRIWSNPNSLLSRIMKERYFKKCTFLESGTGFRPSFAWRSILHGREVLQRGMVRYIGNGNDTNVWAHKWIIDPLPRSPHYREGAEVNLSLKVSDLLFPGSNLWNAHLVRQTFTDHDAKIILSIKPMLLQHDGDRWGFTKPGIYTTQSGYRLLDSSMNGMAQHSSGLPPIEKKLWRSLWKVKTLPKIKHFLWKALAGALAVNERLRSRGLQVDLTCKQCGCAVETINHTLFKCYVAEEVWSGAQIKFPSAGFSSNSVFLNLHHILKCMTDRSLEERQRRAYPWILWQLWKARNVLVFEQTSLSPSAIVDKALDDSDVWFLVNFGPDERPFDLRPPVQQVKWCKPAFGILKCNVGASWSSTDFNSGAGWIVRDHTGTVLFHSRRSYYPVFSEAESEILAFS